jgi:hypothetical protein
MRVVVRPVCYAAVLAGAEDLLPDEEEEDEDELVPLSLALVVLVLFSLVEELSLFEESLEELDDEAASLLELPARESVR